MTLSDSVIVPLDARPRSIRIRLAITVLVYGAVALVVCLLAPLVGSTSISLPRAFDRSIPFADNVDAQIFFVARMPRVLAGAVVAPRWRQRGSYYRRCCEIRWRRHSHSVSPLAPPSVRCWRSRWAPP